jgi:glycosyltransferase involved in cell wall biosynthesis
LLTPLAPDATAPTGVRTTPERMRLLIWYWGRRGAGARYTLETARALGRLGSLDLHLSVSRQSDLYAETKGLGLPGLDVDTFADPLTAAWRTMALPLLARRFRAYLDRQEIDVVLCTMAHPWNGWVARGFCSPHRRYVLTLHDAVPHPGDPYSWFEWLLRGSLHRADALLLLSEHVRGQILSRYGYPADRTWVVPHGPFAFPARLPRRDTAAPPRRLLFFGRILPYKGLPLLLKAFSLIAEQHDLHLHVAGRGHLDHDALQLAAQTRVHMDNRWIPEQEVAEIFHGADLVVVPYIEASQSGVVATAYGMGLPVVVTAVGGLREQVRHGMTGLIAAGTSPQDLAEAIVSLCTDADLYQRCRDGAQQEGRMENAWGGIADQLAGILTAVRRAPPMNPGPHSRGLGER